MNRTKMNVETRLCSDPRLINETITINARIETYARYTQGNINICEL